MKKILTTLCALLFAVQFSSAQCTTTNATSCQCDTALSTDCNLLPDITISWNALLTYMGGPTEYSQTGNGVNNGRLKVSGATPNIGHGPLNVFGIDGSGNSTFICGTDTVVAPTANFVCPNGNPLPHLLAYQRIYHKSGNTMSSWIRPSGQVTYRGGTTLYNDEWGIFTLRIRNPFQPDPRQWSIVGFGHKLGFCLMDYNQCSDWPGHCRDTNTIYNQGTVMLNGAFPNWQLGGGGYGCDPYGQGISSGYEDIYSENLDGMWINIPPGTCNGNYWIVYEVDPHNYFLEEDETNNYTAVPFTLTLQSPPGTATIAILPDRYTLPCSNTTIKLTATAGTSYLWNTGDTVQSIWAGPGTYTVTVTNFCGTGTASYTVAPGVTPAAPTAANDTICVNTSAALNATGTNITWYDSLGNSVGTGNTFNTPILSSSQLYYAEDGPLTTPGTSSYIGKVDSLSAGAYSSSANYPFFTVYRPLKIKSVKVFANGAGNRTIQLMNQIGIILDARIINIPAGESRIDLNFDLQPGKNYSIRGYGTMNLFRNSAGAAYPYVMQDTLSIDSASNGMGSYYFFYNWEIETGGSTCTSPRTPVHAIVQTCIGIDDKSDLNRNISLYPNPSKGEFHLDIVMPSTGDVNASVTDIAGRELYKSKWTNVTGKQSYNVSLSHLSKGVYFMNLRIGNKKYVRKLIIE